MRLLFTGLAYGGEGGGGGSLACGFMWSGLAYGGEGGGGGSSRSRCAKQR